MSYTVCMIGCKFGSDARIETHADVRRAVNDELCLPIDSTMNGGIGAGLGTLASGLCSSSPADSSQMAPRSRLIPVDSLDFMSPCSTRE